jgi:hypothetical protein
MTRNVRGVLAVALLLGTAGCVGGLTGGGSGGSLSFSAGEVHVSNSSVSQTEFEVMADEPITFERTFDVQGQSQTVEMNAHTVQLERSYRGAPLGSMVVLSMPQIRILGQQIDVVSRLNTTSLIEQAQGESSDIQTRQKIDELSVEILGGQRTVEVHRGTASREGSETKVRIYTTTFDHEGDTIVAVAIVPQEVEGEQGAIETLLRGIEYESAS